MTAMRISGLDHIVLNVRDVEQSLSFYQGHLGLAAERVDAWRRGEVRFPSVRINESTIIDLVAADGTNGTARQNLAHFCMVTDDPDLTSTAQDLSRAGVHVEEGPIMRSGARGNALSIYFRDPDDNLIEVRTYARRAAIGSALDQAHAQLRASMDHLTNPDAAVEGYDGWSKRDLIAHLTSIEARIRDQVQCAMRNTPWQVEDIDVFNARQVALRRDWTLAQLRQELEDEIAASSALLGSLSEADLQRPFDHPRRGRITVEDLWSTIPRHLQQHLSDLEATPARPAP
jgi:catechol 2,3-dioxygenase-like lactoylglutathione lyase family enzyme